MRGDSSKIGTESMGTRRARPETDPIKKAKWAAMGILLLGGALIWSQASMALYAFGAGLLLSGFGTILLVWAGSVAGAGLPAEDLPAPGGLRSGASPEAIKAMGSERPEPPNPVKLRAAKLIGGVGLAMLGMSLVAHLGALLLAVS